MKGLGTLFFMVLLAGTASSQSFDSISGKLTEVLEDAYSKGFINGFSVAIVNENGMLYENGFGYADVEQNKKYTASTVQNIASISKTFIGVSLLKAQQLGKLTLDDPINKYLPFDVTNPYFPNDKITIRQLATHTSGIKDPVEYEKYGYVLIEKDNGQARVNRNFREPDEMMAPGDFLENILSKNGKWYRKKNFLKKAPGESFEYSNIAAGLAALVIEKATNESFREFSSKHILRPLEMSGSGWSIPEIEFSRHTKLYADVEQELALYQLVNYPDGGLITSSNDLGKYLTELIKGYNGNGSILDKSSYAELFAPQLTDKNYDQRNDSRYNDEYNMGIFMGISSQGQYGHTGGDPGVVTLMFFDSETNVGKILIINTDVKQDGNNELIDIWTTLEEYENRL